MNQPATSPGNPNQPRPLAAVYLLLALIVAASVLGNLFWIEQNVVQLGHDASAHLTRTLKVAAEWAQPSLQHFMRGLTVTDFRPPGLYIVAQPFYWLFGRSIDSAQYANVAIMAGILVVTFFLARRTVGPWLALLATAITALMPMMLAMARLFYAETLVTLCVIGGLLCLIKSDGFARRDWTLAWGVTLGAGMLAKWTLPVYVAAPLLVVAWRARRQLWPGWAAAIGAPPRRVVWRTVLIAAVAAAAIAALLYWPDRDAWAQSWLGSWLAVGWFALWFALVFLLLWPRTRFTNLLAGLALGAAIAGLWYLPEARFIFELSDVAWGTGEGDYRPNWGNPGHYVRYFRFFYQHHTGLAIALLLLPAGLLPWFWKGRTWLRTLPDAALILVTGLSPFFILMFTSQTSSRNLVPILPLFAVVICIGLLAYSVRVRVAWAATWLAVLLLFGALATFDGLAGLRSQTSLLWPGQAYSVPPASGIADARYWIVPDVLDTIRATSSESTTLGVLLDIAQLHSGSFEYPILRDGQAVDLNSLAGSDSNGVRDVFANQWVLVMDGDNGEMKPPQRAVAASLTGGAAWFHQLYSEVKQYPFPNGETAYLYRRNEGPPDPRQFSTIYGQDVPAIAETVRGWWSPHATLAFATPDAAVWLGTQDVPIDDAVIPGPGTILQPGELADVAGTLVLVSRYQTNDVREWLDREYRYVTEVNNGEFTAILYGRPARPLEPLPVDAAWPDLRVTALQTLPDLRPGEVLPVDLTLDGRLDGSLKVSARLVDSSGNTVAQQDTTALPGVLKLALFAPTDAAPGAYSLQLVVYDAATLAALPDVAGRSPAPLATIPLLEPL